jgi:hypothetical protein
MKSLRKPKGLIRIRKSNKERQDNSQMKRDKKTNNGRQNNTQKTKHLVTQTLLKLRCSGRVNKSCTTRCVANPVTSHE